MLMLPVKLQRPLLPLASALYSSAVASGFPSEPTPPATSTLPPNESEVSVWNCRLVFIVAASVQVPVPFW